MPVAPAPATRTPSAPLPEMTFRAAETVPPMVLFGPATLTPHLPLGTAAVPEALVPMQFPRIALPDAAVV